MMATPTAASECCVTNSCILPFSTPCLWSVLRDAGSLAMLWPRTLESALLVAGEALEGRVLGCVWSRKLQPLLLTKRACWFCCDHSWTHTGAVVLRQRCCGAFLESQSHRYRWYTLETPSRSSYDPANATRAAPADSTRQLGWQVVGATPHLTYSSRRDRLQCIPVSSVNAACCWCASLVVH